MFKEAVSKMAQKVMRVDEGQGRADGRASGGTLTFDHQASGKLWKASLSHRSSAELKAAPWTQNAGTVTLQAYLVILRASLPASVPKAN